MQAAPLNYIFIAVSYN